ncbi:type I secretion system permease/ATPase [Ochrobactrum sp. S46]|nr:type I secretion system permease/ATPase [Ochrobactrum sp. S45]MBK0043676.1 type I secretion system permease/ATPase [Ochrobactrum sp. S46]
MGINAFRLKFGYYETCIVLSIIFLSLVVNILALTSPLFMLQVYDRVLASRSVHSLLGLAILVFFLYAFQAVLDIIRSRILLRIGESFDRKFSSEVHYSVVKVALDGRHKSDGLQPLRDLDNIRGFLSGQGPVAFADLPWFPLYIAICFTFHMWIGITALGGAIILVSINIVMNFSTNKYVSCMAYYNIIRTNRLQAVNKNAEIVEVLGLNSMMYSLWEKNNSLYINANRKVGDLSNGLGGISKAARVMMQSAILGVGAYLVISQETSPGVMIASSIMMGRALAPVDLSIANWKSFTMARHSWRRLKELLTQLDTNNTITSLPPPVSNLSVESVAVAPPGGNKATVSFVSFKLNAGQALGVIGGSGSGKTTLIRAIVGAWKLLSGSVRIDGANIDQWDRSLLGPHIGYLPQSVELFQGSVADNIARFEESPNPQKVISAAKAAGAHELILRLPNGYDTEVGDFGMDLSGGQRQRVGLARALYNDPFLVVLDEPNAHLDVDGEVALVAAIRQVKERRGMVIIASHRPAAVGIVDKLLLMDGGRMKIFGPRDEVFSKMRGSFSANSVADGKTAVLTECSPVT